MSGALLIATATALLGGAPEPQAEAYIEEARRMFAPQRGCRPGAGEGDEIVVCGRRNDERYRLPIRPDSFDPKGPVDSVSRERHRLIQEGDAGVGSCSTVGPGGWTGCFHRQVKRRCEQEGCGMSF